MRTAYYGTHGTGPQTGYIRNALRPQDVFDGIAAQESSRMFLVRLSMMEIYNEVLNDLLDPRRANLKMLEDASGRGCAAGCCCTKRV